MPKQKYTCTFQNNLKKYRQQRGYQRAEAAARIGLPRVRALSQWEKGVKMPDVISLFKLCIIYEASPLELYRDVMHRLNAYLNEDSENLPTIEF